MKTAPMSSKRPFVMFTPIGLFFFLVMMLVIGACTAPQETTPAPTRAAVPAASETRAPAAVATPTRAPAPTPTKGPTRGGTLRLGIIGEGIDLDPHSSSPTRRMWYMSNIYETLVDASPTLELIPGLAESWEVSPDGMIITLKLRKGVKFHDGTDFNAAAVKFNFDRLQDPAQKAQLINNIEHIKSTEVVDDYTVKLNMKQPAAPALAGLTQQGTFIISPAAVKKWGKDEIGRHPAGTGPFELIEWVQDDHLTMKRFESYWRRDEAGDKLPYLDQLVWKPIADETVRMTNLRVSALDWLHFVPAKDVTGLKTSQDLRYISSPPAGSWNIRFSCARPPFNNKVLRQAVNWAIDREAIVKGVLFDVAMPQGTYSYPNVWPYDPNFKGYSYDAAKAKAKLVEAGQPNGFSFTLLVPGSVMETSVSEALQSQLAKVGITVEIKKQDPGTFFAELAKRQFQAAFAQRRADVDQYLTYAELVTGVPRNTQDCSNPKYDELVAKAVKAFAKEEKIAVYREIEKELVEDPFYGYTFFTSNDAVMSKRVQGFIPDITQKAEFRNVWLEK